MENRDAKFAEESSSRIGQKQRTVALYQLERGELALGLLLKIGDLFFRESGFGQAHAATSFESPRAT